MTKGKTTFISQNIEFVGTGDFRPVIEDYNFFIYGEDVYFIGDFDTYLRVDLEMCPIEPICNVDDFFIFHEDIREYYNNLDLYGEGADITLEERASAAELITNIKGFNV